MEEPKHSRSQFIYLFLKIYTLMRRGIATITFFIMFAIMVASHAIPGFALLTGQIIQAVSGVASAAVTANDLAARNRQLELDLENERGRTIALQTERNALHGDLQESRSRLAAVQGELDAFQRENTLLSRQLSDVPRVTLNGVRMTQAEAIRQTMTSVGDRTRRTAIANLGSLAGEAVPFYGIAIIVGATGYELRSACQNMREIYDLTVALDPDSAIPDDRDAVCGMQVPTPEEVWETIVTSPQNVWTGAVSTLDGVGQRISDVEAPSFDGAWQLALGLWDRASTWMD